MGVGAIGNGVVHLLDSLPVSGAAFFVDKQKFAKENLGTCILIGPGDLDTPKAVFAAKLLESKLTTRGFPQDLAEFTATTIKELPYPKIVLNGLDGIDLSIQAAPEPGETALFLLGLCLMGYEFGRRRRSDARK